jgi:peptidoglycan DL-endopeptidase CwlO
MTLVAMAMAIALVAVTTPAPVEASQAGNVISSARNQIGKGYRWAATGMRKFDCSGLVWRMFYNNGIATKIGGRRTASGYLNYFRNRGLASKYNPRKGDLVVWGGGRHVGIYAGSGYAISTLVSGVRRHPVKGWLNLSFTAYLHTRLSQ